MRRYYANKMGMLLAGFVTLAFSGSFAQADGWLAATGFATTHHQPAVVNSHWNKPNGHHHHSLRMQQLFVVTERNPLTGELVGNPRRFSSRLEATQHRESLRSAAWVVWRYVGIGEPMRSVRFTNRFEAEQFVHIGGPARQGFLGTLLLTNETRIQPARVSLDTEYVR